MQDVEEHALRDDDIFWPQSQRSRRRLLRLQSSSDTSLMSQTQTPKTSNVQPALFVRIAVVVQA